LMAPDTVSSTVKVIVWKWAEDVLLNCPVPCTGQPLIVFQPAATTQKSLDLHNLHVKEAQMQINITNDASANVITFFNAGNPEGLNMTAALNAVGERIRNFRILLRCFRIFSKHSSWHSWSSTDWND